jgi:YHS domain-containing protein
LILVVFAVPAWAQHEGHTAAGSQAPAVSPEQLTACVQSQQQVMAVVDAGNRRLELARQTNDSAAMRAAIDDFQMTLSAVRTQLASCAQLAAAAPVPAAPGSGTQPRAAVPTAADPHAGHATPGSQPASTTPPPQRPQQRGSLTSPKQPRAAAADPHAGHAMPPTQPASPAAERAPGPTTSAPPAKPAAPAAADRRAARAMTTTANPATSIDALMCQTQVDAKTAPRMLYEGRMYSFCNEQDRAEFAKNPAKYLKALVPQTAAPTGSGAASQGDHTGHGDSASTPGR